MSTADEDANPYAPPEVEEPLLPDTVLWRIEGIELWVRNGADLPGVDLATGEIHPKEAVRRQIKGHPSKPAAALPLTVFLIVQQVTFRQLDYRGSKFTYLWPLIAMAASLGVMKLVQLWKPGLMTPAGPISFTYDENGRRARKRNRFALVAGAIAVGFAMRAFFIFHLPLGELLREVLFWAVPTIGMLAGFAAMSNRPRPGGISNGWMKVKGLAPEAVGYLREKEHEA